jgi:hypothetical protein
MSPYRPFINSYKNHKMRTIKLFSSICLLTALCSCNQKWKNPLAPGYLSRIPHLEKQGSATRLIADGKPFLMLAGELHNSTCGGLESKRPVWKNMAKKNLNTVIATVSWELIEPEEDKFDFDLVDSMIAGAGREDLKLVLIWFGSWKNGGSVYVPSWIKKNYEKYPRAKDESGKPLEILSTFGQASCDADSRAFATLMRHIRKTDTKKHTVIMMQVENEMGVLDEPGRIPGNARRDFSKPANAAFNGPVPARLMEYLGSHRDSLYPELYRVWKENGFRSSGTWEEIFGKSEFRPEAGDWQFLSFYTEELFSAWNYAGYTEKVAAAGKSEYPLPMYVNAWLKQPGTPWPGVYPSGGPLPQVMDIWRAAAPSIDFLAPDIYVDDFRSACHDFASMGNPLFIPETRGGEPGAARCFYAFGEYSADCFSPFGIDNIRWAEKDPLDESYAVLKTMAPLILSNQGKGTMRGILVDSSAPEQQLELGSYKIRAIFTPAPARNVAGALIIRTGPDEFIAAGKGLDILFYPMDESSRIGIEAADEGIFRDGIWVSERRLNGDETNASTWSGPGIKLPWDKADLQRITIYHYK